jgi:hypothetical protein
VNGPFTLTLHASGPCWIGVTNAAGQYVFQQTLQAGQERQVSGAPPLTVRMGNTRVITMTMNGVRLDLTNVGHTANLRFAN